MKKYHPIKIGLLLGFIGLVALAVCIAAGIWITHELGVLFSNWGADSNYFSDFLGGALGLTVGFALDKLCIERINQVMKYRKLIKIVKNELVEIKKVVYRKEISDSQGNVKSEALYVKNQDGSVRIMAEKCELAAIPYSDMKQESSKVKTAMSGLNTYSEIDHTLEFVLDDLVKNAETMSMLATLPFSGGYSEEFISELSCIQNRIEGFEYYLGKIERGEGAAVTNELEAKIRWLYMQYHINRVLEALKRRGGRGRD